MQTRGTGPSPGRHAYILQTPGAGPSPGLHAYVVQTRGLTWAVCAYHWPGAAFVLPPLQSPYSNCSIVVRTHRNGFSSAPHMKLKPASSITSESSSASSLCRQVGGKGRQIGGRGRQVGGKGRQVGGKGRGRGMGLAKRGRGWDVWAWGASWPSTAARAAGTPYQLHPFSQPHFRTPKTCEGGEV